MDTFCQRFLERECEYSNLYRIIGRYDSKYRCMDTSILFASREQFSDMFPSICLSFFEMKDNETVIQNGHFISLLGFALFVYEYALKDTRIATEVYDHTVVLNTLTDILNCKGFDLLKLLEGERANYLCTLI